jgi:two-component system LytT family response regulator
MIKVIIAEDNIDAQQIIIGFIEPLIPFEVIGIAQDGEELLELNINLNPDLILADINMPKLNGIEAVRSCIKMNPNLKFIFTTAYDEYAVKAFDLNAVDYVVKPINKERLYIALDKAKRLLLTNEPKEQKQILAIKMDRIYYFIPFIEIIYIEKMSRKTMIHTVGKKYETNETLDNIFKKLNHSFFRTHRSFIVNINYISHITLEGETYFAHFRNDSHYAYVSKLRINDLLKVFSNDTEDSK